MFTLMHQADSGIVARIARYGFGADRRPIRSAVWGSGCDCAAWTEGGPAWPLHACPHPHGRNPHAAGMAAWQPPAAAPRDADNAAEDTRVLWDLESLRTAFAAGFAWLAPDRCDFCGGLVRPLDASERVRPIPIRNPDGSLHTCAHALDDGRIAP